MAERKNREIGVTVELRKLMHAQPFAKFRIKTTDGDTFTIEHPDFVMISPRGDMAIIYAREEEGHHVLNLRHIVSMEPLRNGSRKPGRR
ncbi:MAG: hypothetical protein QOF78_2741 [Phycisphaerales bacterium]|jgi:hypothetical protein|nr:hypothetical protein [Phycisphaerales bacterium]